MKEYIVRCEKNKFTIDGEIVRCKECRNRHRQRCAGRHPDWFCADGLKQVTGKLNDVEDSTVTEDLDGVKEQKSKLEVEPEKRTDKHTETHACDSISRQAVEEMIKAEMPERGMWEIEGDKGKETVCEVCVDLMQKLSELPPVEPEPKRPKRTETMMVDGEPTEIDPLSYEVGYTHGQSERPKGEWIMHLDDLFPEESSMECSICHEEQPLKIDDNFCPNCGADMRGDK